MTFYKAGKPTHPTGKEAFKAKMKQIAEDATAVADDLKRWSITLECVSTWNKDRYLHASKVYTVAEYAQTVKRLLSTPCPVTVANIATQWIDVNDSSKEDDYKITAALTKCIKLIKDAHRDIPIFLSKVRADGFDD